jgi:hypothetical protein
MVYTAGLAAAYGLGRAAAALIHIRRYCRQSLPIEDQSACEMFDRLRQQLGIRPAVALRESPQLGGAATVGWRQPLVLLPASWRAWSPEEMRAVLAHELAHVRERHFPSRLLSQLAVVAHYYHPLVHWLARRLQLEQEISADRVAADLFGNRHQFAAILARLALQTPPPAVFAGVGLFMSRPLLMRRIAVLRQSSAPVRRLSRFSPGAMLVLLIAAAIGVAGLRLPPSAIAEDAAAAPDVELPADVLAAEPQVAPLTPPAAQIDPSTPVTPPVAAGAPPAAEPLAPAAAPAPLLAPPEIGAYAHPIMVTALLQVSRSPVDLVDQPVERLSDSAWQINNKTQIALLKSYFVLQSALRQPEIASLPIVKEQQSPIEWLHRNIIVGFYPNTEILFVTLPTTASAADQARQLVDAIVKAYMDEVVDADKQRRLASRDALARSLDKLNDELSRKMSDYYDIAKELEAAADSGSGQLLQQLDMRRLDRVESELMRLEDESLKARIGETASKEDLAYYKERIEQLRERQEELEKKLRARSDNSVELVTRKSEIDQLQKIIAEMSHKLELLDINVEAPQTIRIIQNAIAIRADSAQNRPPK